jgi:hypothetical protein
MYNVADAEVMDRIRAIGTSAYWSNTLLFCIGYISKFKPYLHPNIESFCGELNGSSDDEPSLRLSSIPKMGSWLALDILQEGIFRDFPAIENKFAHLLRPLFDIPPILRHRMLCFLPERIVHRFLNRYIKDVLETSYSNKTAWVVEGMMVQEDIGDWSDLIGFWPGDKEDRWDLLLLLSRYTEIFGLVASYLADFLTKEDKFTLYMFLRQDNHFLEIAHVCFRDRNKTAILIELYFLRLLDKRDSPQVHAAFSKVLGIDIEHDFERSYSGSDGSLFALPGLFGSYTFKSIDSFSNTVFQPFFEKAKELHIQWVVALGEFLEDPCVEKFDILTDVIHSEDYECREFILNKLRRFNSFFASVYRWWEPTGKQEIQQMLVDMEQIDGGLYKENPKLDFIYLDLAMNFDLLGPDDSDFDQVALVDGFYRYCFPDETVENANIDSLYFYALIRSLFECDYGIRGLDSSEGLTYIASHPFLCEKVKEGFLVSCESRGVAFSDLGPLLYLLDINVIKDCLDQVHFSRLWCGPNAGFDAFRSVDLDSRAYDKMLDVVNLQVLSGGDPDYKILLQLGICMTRHVGVFYCDKLVWQNILYQTRSTKDEPYKALLLLMAPDFDERYHEAVVRILNGVANSSLDNEFQDFLLELLPYVYYSSHRDKTFIFLMSRLSHASSVMRGQIMEILMTYIGAQEAVLPI